MLAWVGAWGGIGGLQGASEAMPGRPEEFFGLTNLWTFRLVISAAAWRGLEPVERPGRPSGPGVPGMPGTPRGPGGPPGFDREFPWGWGEFHGAGADFTRVALRFKGNSSFHLSRAGRKRPFKIDFDRDHPGRRLAGLEELWLSNNANDPSQMREVLAYAVCRRAGLEAPRTALARVFLERPGEGPPEYLGVYTVVEAVGGDFLRRCFGTKKGLLAKPERLEGLAYLGPDWENYPGRYEVKNDPAGADRRRLIELTRWVNESPDAEFEAGLEERLDLTNWVRFLAVNALLANLDSFLGNGHNYYLFLPHGDGRARFIPWDLNEAFGRHPMAGPPAWQADLAILRPAAGRNRLVERFLASRRGAELYRAELGRLRSGPASLERLLQDVDALAGVLEPAVAGESPLARRQFGFAVLGQAHRAEGLDGRPGPEGGSFRGPPGPDGPRGPDLPLRDWIRLRHQNVGEQLEGKREGRLPMRRRPGPGPWPGRPGPGPAPGPPREPGVEDGFPPPP
ncbi:MAG: CotH kinase family protein [Verrucomicrobiota bacterium]